MQRGVTKEDILNPNLYRIVPPAAADDDAADDADDDAADDAAAQAKAAAGPSEYEISKKLENINNAIEILKTKFTPQQIRDINEIIEKKMHIQRISGMAESPDVPQEQNTVKKLIEEFRTRIAHLESDLELQMTIKFTPAEKGILIDALSSSRVASLKSNRDYVEALLDLEKLRQTLVLTTTTPKRGGGKRKKRSKKSKSKSKKSKSRSKKSKSRSKKSKSRSKKYNNK
jgi:hypothetical protein